MSLLVFLKKNSFFHLLVPLIFYHNYSPLVYLFSSANIMRVSNPVLLFDIDNRYDLYDQRRPHYNENKKAFTPTDERDMT